MPSARSQRRSRPARKAGYSMQARKAKSSMPSSDYTSDTDQSDGEEGGYSCNGRKLRRTRGYYDLTNESESEDCYSRGRRASDKRKREGGHRSPRGRRPRATSNGHGVEQEDSSRDESKAVLKRGLDAIKGLSAECRVPAVPQSAGHDILQSVLPLLESPASKEIETQLGVWYQRETATRGKLSQAATTSLDKAKNIQAAVAETLSSIRNAESEKIRLVQAARCDFEAMFAAHDKRREEATTQLKTAEKTFRLDVKKVPTAAELLDRAKQWEATFMSPMSP